MDSEGASREVDMESTEDIRKRFSKPLGELEVLPTFSMCDWPEECLLGPIRVDKHIEPDESFEVPGELNPRAGEVRWRVWCIVGQGDQKGAKFGVIVKREELILPALEWMLGWIRRWAEGEPRGGADMRVFKFKSIGEVHMDVFGPLSPEVDSACHTYGVSVIPEWQNSKGSPSDVTCENCRRTKVFKEALALAGLGVVAEEMKNPEEVRGHKTAFVGPAIEPPSDEDVRGTMMLMWDGLVAAQWDAHERVGWICPRCSARLSPDERRCSCEP